MSQVEIIVVGAGPAGASAALALAGLGCRVLLVEQRDRAGGAIHRQPLPGVRTIGPRRYQRRWTEIERRLAAEPLVRTIFSTVYLGVDGAGRVLLDDRQAGRVTGIAARGLILATGAIERVHPFEGWDLPGVMTVGGAQMLLKETGTPPSGPILIAGSGPLLYAAAAQLAGTGAEVIGILERGRPLRPLALALLGWPRQAMQAATHLFAALRLGLRPGVHVQSAKRADDGLEVVASDGRVWRPRTLLVHDGIAASLAGQADADTPFPVETAGDGREVLGADAMPDAGRAAAYRLARRLGLDAPEAKAAGRARRFQSLLTRLFAHDLPAPTATTMLCRCEGQRFGDVAALGPLSPRETRLTGRIGMGACQGRYCSRHIDTGTQAGPDGFRPAVPRWPQRPVSLASLAGAHRPDTERLRSDD